MRRSIPTLIFGASICAALLLGGCQRYSLTLNERELYRPQPLLTDYSVADRALQTCIDEHIRSQSVRHPDQLVSLNCSYAGIQTLDGIQQFSRLEAIQLKGNPIEDFEPLLSLPHLRLLDLSETPDPNCEHLQLFVSAQIEQLILPSVCAP